MLEINVSCPNVSAGGMSVGTDPVALSRLITRLRKITDKKMIVKLTPNVTDITVPARAAVESGADALLDWLKPYELFTFRDGPEPDFIALHRQIGKSVMPKTDDPWGQALIDSMVLLIKEELHHFWQVREAMLARDIPYVKITASRYAKGMLKDVRTHEPLTLIDKLICGAYIEARSCERFAALAPFLDDDLQKFYLSLLRSEARHYQDYLTLARQVSDDDISPRIKLFGEIEATLISTPDNEFRFHSGVPV